MRRGDKDLIFVDPDGGRTRRVTDLTTVGLSGCPVWSADGRQLAVVQGPTDLALLLFDPTRPVAGQQIERIPPPPQGMFYPRAWSPDGTRLAGSVGNTLAVLDRKTGRYTMVAEATRVLAGSDLAWLPDSRRIMTMLDPRTIGLFDTRSSEVRTVYSSGTDLVRSFDLSPAGTELYISRGPDEADIWIATIQSQ